MKNRCVGGVFGLDDKIVKLYNLARYNDNKNEKNSARKALLRRGWFLDSRLWILWNIYQDNIPDFILQNADLSIDKFKKTITN